MLRRTLLPCLVLLVLALAATASAQPVAHISKSCSLSAKEKGGSKPSSLGTTYVTSLSATKVSCGKAKGVVKAFNSCRHKHGAAGRCSGKAAGYSCNESRQSSPVQYDASATCKSGKKKVAFHYTQNT